MAKRTTATKKKSTAKKKTVKKKSNSAANSRAVKTSVKKKKKATPKKSNAAKTTKKKTAKPNNVPASAGYSGTPLIKKLGIKPDSTLTLLGEPAGFLLLLGDLPEKLRIRKTALGDRDLTIWFPRNANEFKRRISSIAAGVNDGGLWIAWPKKTSGIKTDLTQDLIRDLSLKEGIVDYKICAINETYSGLKFANRKKIACQKSTIG